MNRWMQKKMKREKLEERIKSLKNIWKREKLEKLKLKFVATNPMVLGVPAKVKPS